MLHCTRVYNTYKYMVLLVRVPDIWATILYITLSIIELNVTYSILLSQEIKKNFPIPTQ